MSDIKVSVSLITYNHEKYISDCIKSILSQKTDFKFELVVSNDCSSDATGRIIDDLAARHPDRIRVIHRSENLGIARNAIGTIRECNGEYIALMEGDDIWLDERKLQSQADFLDQNRECALCFTNQLVFFDSKMDEGKVFFGESLKPPEIFDLDYFLKHNVSIPNNSKMFRKKALPAVIPEWIFDSFQWDWALHIIQGNFGKYGYIDRVTLGYRRHAAAMVRPSNNILLAKSGIRTLKGLNRFFDYRRKQYFGRLAWHYNLLAFACLERKNLAGFIGYYMVSLINIKSWSELRWRDDLWKVKQFCKKQLFSGQGANILF